MADITRILAQIELGDVSSSEQLLPLVYDELRKLAASKLVREKPGQTLQATALVYEAYLRLVGNQSESQPSWTSMNRVWAPLVYKLCGRDIEAAKAIQDAESLIDDNAWWISNTAKLWSGKITPEEMLREAKSHRYQLTHHFSTLAFYFLTQPNGREKAIEYNNRAIALNCRAMDTYSWCKALKAKLDRDSEWPASLKSSKVRQRIDQTEFDTSRL
jgi:ECF sigma factor